MTRGRPRTADVAAVTEVAMQTFWQHGYGATSISRLTAATGMHPGAIYQTFGDKRGLLLAALARYREIGVQRIRGLLSGSSSPLAGLRSYLLNQAALSHAANGDMRGCLAGNSALELLPGDPAVTEAIRVIFTDLHGCIADAVTSAQRRGEIDARWPADTVAAQLLTLVEGMFVLGRTARDPQQIEAVVDLTLRSLRPATTPETLS
ncbi:TetR/AcrR family transcriptional regulator [Nocardia sp. NPDC051900]|uniref:TetR/AcrR family transcriptional regulator n=1 Tax=Nocardia sp. NPDC051900 TaxID=3364326 RepID=UPI00379246FA